MVPSTFYSFAPQCLYVFIGFLFDQVIERCQSIGTGIENPTELPDDLDVDRLWQEIPRTVQFFVSAQAPWSSLQRVLPPEQHYDRIRNIVFILVENNLRFAEQWMSQSKPILLSLSEGVHCKLQVENSDHVIRISPLGHSTVKVDVSCSTRDTESLWRLAPLTRGNWVELSVNTLSAEHLPALGDCFITSLKSPYNSCSGILHSISSLQHLRVLALTSTSRSLQQSFHGALPCLEMLKLDMPIEHVLQVFSGFYTAALKTLEVNLPELNGPSNLTQLANLLSQRCARSLNTLCIRVHGVDPSETASWRNILPFQTLSSLRSFTVQHPFPLGLTTDQIRALLKAWPHAVSISLNPRAAIPQQGPVGLSHMNVLIALRRYSPATLRYFGISIDPETAVNSGWEGEFLGRSSHLTTLDIGTCRITDALRVLPVINILFPTLEHVEHGPAS